MLLAVLDIIGDSIPLEIIPQENNFIILCDESCMIPDILNSKHLSFSQNDSIPQGHSHMRISSDLHRGILVSQIFQKVQGLKMYTSRRDTFAQYFPVGSIDFIQIPQTFSSKIQSENNFILKKASISNDSQSFDMIYQESLVKYVKTFLMERNTRANKIKSAKAQAKNLVDGVITAFNKKYGKYDVDSEIIVDALFNDLENHEIISVGITVEYNDAYIQEYFGRNRSMLFNPGHRSSEVKTEVRVRPAVQERICEEVKVEEINYHEYTEHALGEFFGKFQEISTIMHLYRACNSILREYIDSKNKVLDDISRSKILLKILKLMLDTFYTADTSLSNEEIVKEYTRNGSIKLVLKP